MQTPRRPIGFRAGVHKSESAKEMLLSQQMFGALPPSPPSSSADVNIPNNRLLQESSESNSSNSSHSPSPYNCVQNLTLALFFSLFRFLVAIAQEIDALPPLPPLPTESNADIYENKGWPESHGYRSTSLGKIKYESRYRDSIESAPPVPPHRCPSADNTLRTM